MLWPRSSQGRESACASVLLPNREKINRLNESSNEAGVCVCRNDCGCVF